jgi:tRNA 5-methylaminomethyl-2-thiouridine biosynthesis bifunctional protein
MTLQKSGMTFKKPWFTKYTNTNNSSHIIIIGGGISGAATAYSLARRGYKVTLYEQNEQLANAASGNYQAILYGNFSAHNTPLQELSFSGYRYSHNLINLLLNSDAREYANCGLIQLGFDDREIKSQLELIKSNIADDFCHLVNRAEIEQLAGINVNYDSGLYFPSGLWLNPQSLVKKLVDSSNIKIVLRCKVDEITQQGNNWQLVKNGKIIDSAANLVLCNADSVNQFAITKKLNIRKIRGQISIVKDNGNNKLQTILCGSGYVTPNRLGSYTLGATFDYKNIHSNITAEDNLQNMAAANLISDAFKQINPDNLTAQAAIRASIYDYLPLVGPLAGYEQFMTTYEKLAKDKNLNLNDECPYYKGLYLNVAHGSKGMLSAPLCGEIIANYINNTPVPCSESLRIALHPNRLYVRELVKG